MPDVLVLTWARGQGEPTGVPLRPPPGLSGTCCLQVEHDPAHGERLLLAHQERDRVSGWDPAGALLHPLLAQVGHLWCWCPNGSPAPQPALCLQLTLTAILLSHLRPGGQVA